MWGRYTFAEEFCRDGGRANPDNILVQSKVASVCPGIIPGAGTARRGRLLSFYHLLQETCGRRANLECLNYQLFKFERRVLFSCLDI